jgi:hypothetical protein
MSYKYPSIDHINFESNRKWNSDSDEEKDNYRYYIQEKIDGSQITFMKENNKLIFFNKGKKITDDNKVFRKAIIMLNNNRYLIDNINENYIYHGEAVCNIQHNVAKYNRTPKYYFILYDIVDKTTTKYINPNIVTNEAVRLGLEMVPILYYNEDPNISPYEKCKELMNDIESDKLTSILGGQPEGIVLKHHNFINKGKSVSTKQKYVSDQFKESHKMKKIIIKRSEKEFIEELGLLYATNARFHKAYQHLRDANELQNDKNDIFKLINELDKDLEKEYIDEIKNYLWCEFSGKINDYSRTGFKLWYEQLLLNNSNKHD